MPRSTTSHDSGISGRAPTTAANRRNATKCRAFNNVFGLRTGAESVGVNATPSFVIGRSSGDSVEGLRIVVRPTLWLGRLLWKGGDGWLIDGFGPDGVSARVIDVTRNVVRLQTGYMYHYAFAMLIGVAAFITWFMFLAGGH